MMLQAKLEEKKDSEICSLSQQIKELGERLQKIEEKDKWFQEKFDLLSKEISAEQQECQSLREGLYEVKQKAAKLKSGTKKTTESLNSTQDRIEDFRKRLADIKQEIKAAQRGDLLTVDYSRIACYFEQALCLHVLPEVFVNKQDASIHDLLDYLNSDDKGTFPLDASEYDCKKILSEARERWGAMCEKLDLPSEWKTRRGDWKVCDGTIPSEIRAMDILRLGRESILDKPKSVSLKFVEESLSSIKDVVPSWEFELVVSFIGSLRTKLVKSGLAHKCLLPD